MIGRNKIYKKNHTEYGDDGMNFYKNKTDNFFVQLDHEQTESQDLIQILVENHEGDEHKHQPILTKEGRKIKVKIGDVMHPMTLEHHISMIFLKTKQGGQYKLLSYLESPIVTFELSEDDEPLEVYGYCNLHGLWKEAV